MLSYRAIYILEDESTETGWIPYERSVVTWLHMPPKTALDDPAGYEVGMVISGEKDDDRLVPAASIPGFVTIVEPEMPVQDVVLLCRSFLLDAAIETVGLGGGEPADEGTNKSN